MQKILHFIPDLLQLHFQDTHGSFELHEQQSKLITSSGAGFVPMGCKTGRSIWFSLSIFHPYSEGSKLGGFELSADFHTHACRCARRTCKPKASEVGLVI